MRWAVLFVAALVAYAADHGASLPSLLLVAAAAAAAVGTTAYHARR